MFSQFHDLISNTCLIEKVRKNTVEAYDCFGMPSNTLYFVLECGILGLLFISHLGALALPLPHRLTALLPQLSLDRLPRAPLTYKPRRLAHYRTTQDRLDASNIAQLCLLKDTQRFIALCGSCNGESGLGILHF